MTQKETFYNFCQFFVEDRLSRIQKNITSIQEALRSETKSSAGDKHETGRAMLQLEREKLGQQLAEAETMKQTLAKVTINNCFKTVQLGSWVKTTAADYFLAISAGAYKGEVASVYCISIKTPIARLLLGKSIGDTVFFNGSKIKIIDIF